MIHEENMTLEQIQAEMTRLQEMADKRRQAEQAEVIKVIKDLVAKHKLHARDVFPPKEKKASTVAPKYRDHQNAENTWTGRGKMPTWLAQRVAEGHGVESFLIPTDATPYALEVAPGGEDSDTY